VPNINLFSAGFFYRKALSSLFPLISVWQLTIYIISFRGREMEYTTFTLQSESLNIFTVKKEEFFCKAPTDERLKSSMT